MVQSVGKKTAAYNPENTGLVNDCFSIAEVAKKCEQKAINYFCGYAVSFLEINSEWKPQLVRIGISLVIVFFFQHTRQRSAESWKSIARIWFGSLLCRLGDERGLPVRSRCFIQLFLAVGCKNNRGFFFCAFFWNDKFCLEISEGNGWIWRASGAKTFLTTSCAGGLSERWFTVVLLPLAQTVFFHLIWAATHFLTLKKIIPN